MPGKILLPQDMSKVGKDYLTERGYEIVMGSGTDEASMMKDIADCDGLIIRVPPVTANILRAGKKLKVVGRHGVGVDNIDVAAATELGIRVTNGPESNCEEVAEHAMTMLLALEHRLRDYDSAVRTGNWNARNQIRGASVTGKTAAIIGYGKIGRRLAAKLHGGLDMKILVYHSHVRGEVPEYVELVDSLEELLSRADVVSLNCPSTPETRGMITRERIACMKPTACLVNCARGDLVDEEVLCEALSEQRIRGAALDVFAENELPGDHPLTKLDNVILTPHCASHTQEGLDKMALHAAMGVDEVLSGKPVTWPVN
ncbi:MAG: hydroxyacid dehydrogenase [Clostridiales bacterium]|nr:hydroxyacid dehydrogenase [Clostridiales bacterium]